MFNLMAHYCMDLCSFKVEQVKGTQQTNDLTRVKRMIILNDDCTVTPEIT